MKSPLSVDKQTVKEFNIPKECELHPRQKVAFIIEQIEQLKQMQWRARVDVVHATRLTESDNETLRNKGFQNISEHKNQVNQFTGGIVMLQKYVDELRAEYPEMGLITPADQIEG